MSQSDRYVGTVRSLKIQDIGDSEKEIMPLVLNLATKLYNPDSGITYEHLVEVGLEGVAIARSKWRRSRKVMFTTLAFYFIRGRMLDTIESELKHAARFQSTDPADMVDMVDSCRAAPDMMARLEHASTMQRVNAIISREFTVEQQTVLRWHLNGESIDEIGASLCIPGSHVQAVIDGCIKTLRNRLGVK